MEIPEDHLCARCGYPSGRSGTRVCSECGWRATSEEVHARAARLDIVRRWESESPWVEWWIVVGVVYSLGAALVTKSLLAGVGAALAFAVGIPASVLLGGLWLGRCDADRGAYLRVIWRRSLWILHLPCLVAPLFVGAALLAGLIDLWAADPAHQIYTTVVFGGWVTWCVGCLVAVIAWWIRRLRALETGGYTSLDWADAWAAVAGLLVATGAGLLGLLAAMGAAFGVAS